MKKKTEPVPTGLREALEKHGLIVKGMKYTNYELLQILDKTLTTQERSLAKAREIYREQEAKIERLSSPQLWRFSTRTEAPPDYKEEYMRRLKDKGRASLRVKVVETSSESH